MKIYTNTIIKQYIEYPSIRFVFSVWYYTNYLEEHLQYTASITRKFDVQVVLDMYRTKYVHSWIHVYKIIVPSPRYIAPLNLLSITYLATQSSNQT